MENDKKRIKIKDKEFVLFIKESDIRQYIQKIAADINKDLKGKDPLFLVVLNGSFMFAADLMKSVNIDCRISFVKLSSYSGITTTTVARELIGLDECLTGRHVVIVEDIIDTGHTMAHLLEKVRDLGAREIKIATLTFKPDAFKYDYPIDYIGISIPNDFIVGYGLDYDGYGRNSADIYKIV